MSDKDEGVHPSIDLSDIQGLVRFGFKHHTDAAILLLTVKDSRAAREWLANVNIASAEKLDPVPSTLLQVALTSCGMIELQVPQEIVSSFSDEFIHGMSGDENRARRLGDVGENAPCKWSWGSGNKIPHIAVFLYAMPGKLEDFRRAIESQLRAGFEMMDTLDTSPLNEENPTEPFGFRDGLSQPQLDWARERAVKDATRLEYDNLSCLGEHLLGFPNEYGRYTPRPLLSSARDPSRVLPRAEDDREQADLGRNGSYLVIRTLQQDVHGFWRKINDYAAGVQTDRETLAAAMVGRTLTGEPLAQLLTPPRSVKMKDAAQDVNTFTFDSDADGSRCPLGAHIRRANPRNADMSPGTSSLLKKLIRTFGFDERARREDLVASTRFHRLLRRGRGYGESVSLEQALQTTNGHAETGIHFICLGANIQRQFEFVQSAWLMTSKFNGLCDEADPLLGNRLPDFSAGATNNFCIPSADGPAQRLTGLPQFVTVRGGAYFFLPGIKALRYLATH